MEVKVGQVWKNKAGDAFEIIGVSKDHFAWKMDDGEIGCTPIKFWSAIQEPVLVSDSPLSELEIVQKALEQEHCFVEITGDGAWHLFERISNESIGIVGDTVLGLLTWAKQTIGVE